MGTIVQSKFVDTLVTTGPYTAQFTNPTTAGNSLVVAIATGNSGSAVVSGDLVDDQGNTYQFIGVFGSPASQIAVWYCLAPTHMGTALTYTFTHTNAYQPGIGIFEVSPLSGVDVNINETNATASPFGPGSSGTLAQADELAIAIAEIDNGVAGNWGFPSGFTNLGNYNSGADGTVKSIDYKLTSSTAALNPSYTYDASITLAISALITFKFAASSSAASPGRMGQPALFAPGDPREPRPVDVSGTPQPPALSTVPQNDFPAPSISEMDVLGPVPGAQFFQFTQLDGGDPPPLVAPAQDASSALPELIPPGLFIGPGGFPPALPLPPGTPDTVVQPATVVAIAAVPDISTSVLTGPREDPTTQAFNVDVPPGMFVPFGFPPGYDYRLIDPGPPPAVSDATVLPAQVVAVAAVPAPSPLMGPTEDPSAALQTMQSPAEFGPWGHPVPLPTPDQALGYPATGALVQPATVAAVAAVPAPVTYAINITVTNRGNFRTTTDQSAGTASTATSSSFSPAANAVLAVIVEGTLDYLSIGATDLTFTPQWTGSGTVTWRQYTVADNDGHQFCSRVSVFLGQLDNNPGTDTVKISRDQTGNTSDQWIVCDLLELSGASGLEAQHASVITTSSTPTVTLPANPAGSSILLGGGYATGDSDGVTVPSGTTALTTGGNLGDSVSSWYDHDGTLAVSNQWSGFTLGGGENFIGLVVEVATAVPQTVTAVPVAATAAVPTPTFAMTAAPAAVAAFAVVPAPTVSASSGTGDITVTPSTVTAVAAVPTPTTLPVKPATVVATAAVAKPNFSVIVQEIGPVAAIAAVPSLSAGAITSTTVTPSTVVATAAVPTPGQARTVEGPAAVAAVAFIPGPTVVAATPAPATVVGVASVPTPTVFNGIVVTPAPVVAIANVLVPHGLTEQVAQPAAVAAVATVPDPTRVHARRFGRTRLSTGVEQQSQQPSYKPDSPR